MNHAEPAAADSSTDLKNKTLLVISSPNPKKKFIYQRLKELGSKMILMSSEANWVTKLTDGFVECDPLDEVACMAKVEEPRQDAEDRRRHHLLGKRGAAVRHARPAFRLDRPHAAGRPSTHEINT